MSIIKIPIKNFKKINNTIPLQKNNYKFFEPCLQEKTFYLNLENEIETDKADFILTNTVNINKSELPDNCKQIKFLYHTIENSGTLVENRNGNFTVYNHYSVSLKKNIKIASPDQKKNRGVEYLSVTDKESIPKFVFSIRRFEKTTSGRLHMTIYCYDIQEDKLSRHIYYTSLSEGRFWRLCVYRREDGGYEKGSNYVTTSFIDMELQKFIFLNESKYNHRDDLDPKIEDCKFELSESLQERFNDDTWKVNEPIFGIFEAIFPHKTYKNPIEYNNRIIKLNHILIKKNLDKSTNQRLQKLYNLLKKYKLLINTGKNRREFYTRWYQKVILGLFFQEFDIFRDSLKEVYKNKQVEIVQNKKSTNINMDIYSIKIKSKNTGYVYELFYMQYYVDYQPLKKFKHIISISLLSNNNLNKYGLRQKYVAAGLLINKIFDYYSQIGITALSWEGILTSIDYTFIGDVFNVPFLP
jgi:hypothetical protein